MEEAVDPLDVVLPLDHRHPAIICWLKEVGEAWWDELKVDFSLGKSALNRRRPVARRIVEEEGRTNRRIGIIL